MNQLIEFAKRKKWGEFAYALAGVTSIPKNALTELFVRSTSSGRIELLQQLLDLGADVNGRWNTYTALGTAATLINPDSIRFLLKHGAVVDAPSFEDATPLICVAKFPRQFGIAEFRPNAVKAAKILLAAKPDLDRVDIFGCTALDYAYQTGWPELAKVLHSAGARIAACEHEGAKLLTHAVTATIDDRLLKLYLGHGGDPNAKFADTMSALDYVRGTIHEWAVKLLVKAGGKSLAGEPPVGAAVTTTSHGSAPKKATSRRTKGVRKKMATIKRARTLAKKAIKGPIAKKSRRRGK